MSKSANLPAHIRRHVRNRISAAELKKFFIVFSAHTKGLSGRKLMIDSRLLPVFLSAVDPVTHDGTEVIRKIVALRAMAGLGGSYKNQDAFEHMIYHQEPSGFLSTSWGYCLYY